MKFEADFGAQVTEVDTEQEAAAILMDDSDFQLIMIDLDNVDIKGSYLYQYVRSNDLDIPFVLVSNSDLRDYKGLEKFRADHRGNRLIPKPINHRVFSTVIKDALATSKISVVKAKHDPTKYTPVKIDNFMRFNNLPCEAFIKLSENKYLKLINANDMYSSEVISKYIEKAVTFLYVRQTDYQVFADTGLSTLLQLYDRKPKSEKLQSIQLMAIEDIHKRLHELSVDPEVAELTKKTVESSVMLIKRHKNISHLLNTMRKNADYIYDHSLKLSYIATAIAKNTEWSSDNTCFKLSLAAMMHDMTLTDHNLARFDSIDDPNLANFPEEQVKKFREHPFEASALIRENKQLPADIDFIVAQHHEKPDGRGFPRGLSKLRISPLSCLFIIAHQFLNIIEQHQGVFSQQNMFLAIDQLSNKGFATGNFKKPYQGLLKAFKIET